MRPRSRRFITNLLTVGTALVASVAAFAAPEPSSVWVARAWGSSYDAQDILQRFPAVKRVYIPFYQAAPVLSDKPLTIPETYLAKEVEAYKIFHAKGVEVYGIFTPLLVDNLSAVGAPDWIERSLIEAFGRKTTSPYLSIYNPKVEAFCRDTLRGCLQKGSVDGIVLNLMYPTQQLYGYGEAAREHFVRKYRFDPIDVIYPLGLSATVELKDQDMIDTIIKDRLDQADLFAQALQAVCQASGKPCIVLSSLSSYDYPAATRAASTTDWARLLLEQPNGSVILTSPDGEPLTTDRLTSFLGLLDRLKIDPARVEIIALPANHDRETIERFFRESGSKQPKVSVLYPKT